MKNLSLIIGLILLALNIIAGFLLSAYQTHSLVITSIIIAVTTLLNHCSSRLRLKDAFKISLPFLFSVFGVVEFILGFFVKKELTDDYYLISILVLFVIQVIIFATVYIVSNHSVKSQNK